MFRILLVLLVFGTALPISASAQSLWWWQQRIDWSFKVDQLEPKRMSEWIAEDANDLVIFDVREPGEAQVSRLANSIQVSPNMSADEFERRFAQILRDRKVVFYCSIGWRSSDFADRMAPIVAKYQAEDAYNLRGGIFRWHNEERRLVDSDGQTNYVHPFDDEWGELVKRQDMTTYEQQ